MNFLGEYEAELREKTEQQLEKEAFEWSCLPHHEQLRIIEEQSARLRQLSADVDWDNVCEDDLEE